MVKGVEELLSKTNGSWGTYTVPWGEKLVLFLQDNEKIWCAEIALET